MFDRIIFGLVATVVLFAMDSNAAENNDLVCRAKAKDVAVQMYQSCVTESRNKRIDEIRKEYQEKLANLKNHYDSELKKMGGAEKAKTEARNGRKQKPTASTAKNGLPNKTVRTETLGEPTAAKTVEIPEPTMQEEVPAPEITLSPDTVTSSDIE